MVAKLVQAEIDPGDIDAAASAVARELIPRFVAHVGARQGYWMANRSTGHVLAMTCWSSREALLAAQSADGTERARVAERIGLRIRAIETMDVVAAHEPVTADRPLVRWARATWVEGVSSELRAELPAMHGDVVPDQARSRGFRGSYWLADPEAGNGLALSFWDGPAELVDSERGSRRRRRHFERTLGCRINGIGEYEALAVVAHAQLNLRDRPTSAFAFR